jgi:hypothetical protein
MVSFLAAFRRVVGALGADAAFGAETEELIAGTVRTAYLDSRGAKWGSHLRPTQSRTASPVAFRFRALPAIYRRRAAISEQAISFASRGQEFKIPSAPPSSSRSAAFYCALLRGARVAGFR